MLGADIENCSKKKNFYHENYEFLGEKQASCNSPKMGLGAKKTPSAYSYISYSVFIQYNIIGIGVL